MHDVDVSIYEPDKLHHAGWNTKNYVMWFSTVVCLIWHVGFPCQIEDHRWHSAFQCGAVGEFCGLANDYDAICIVLYCCFGNFKRDFPTCNKLAGLHGRACQSKFVFSISSLLRLISTSFWQIWQCKCLEDLYRSFWLFSSDGIGLYLYISFFSCCLNYVSDMSSKTICLILQLVLWNGLRQVR